MCATCLDKRDKVNKKSELRQILRSLISNTLPNGILIVVIPETAALLELQEVSKGSCICCNTEVP